MGHGTHPISCSHQKESFRYWFPNKKGLGLDLDKKTLFEDFYIKIFNWKRKESNSNFQLRCAYQTTTNIALLWKMVRIVFLFPTRKKLSGIGSPTKKARVLIWTKKSLFEDFYIKIVNWKRKESNSNFQLRCAYQTTTNIALLWKMVRIVFLFPTRKKLSGIGSPTKKAQVLIWTKKSLFEDFYIKIFNWKRKESNSNFQVRCAYQITINIALLCKIFELEEPATWFPSSRSFLLSKFLLTCSVSGCAWRYAL